MDENVVKDKAGISSMKREFSGLIMKLSSQFSIAQWSSTVT